MSCKDHWLVLMLYQVTPEPRSCIPKEEADASNHVIDNTYWPIHGPCLLHNAMIFILQAFLEVT